MRRTLATLLLGAAIIVGATVVAASEARRYQIAACERECWWERRFHRCMKRCLKEARRYSRRRWARPGLDSDSQPVELWLRFPSHLISGGLAGAGLVGLLALILRAIDRAMRRHALRTSIERMRRAKEHRRRMYALAREADDTVKETRAEIFRRRHDV